MVATKDLVTALKAAGESTRLRLLALLGSSDLNVKDLTRILAQSQPRISRHLKLLVDAGLIERFREGSWVYFRLAEEGPAVELVHTLLKAVDPNDPLISRDRARAESVKKERARAAQDYFKTHAPQWDKIRSLHVKEGQVEDAMCQALGPGPVGLLADIGTGTGRILELFADQAERGIGIDINPDMLAYARTNLERADLAHCHVRHGDLFDLPFDDQSVDTVIVHQVLHFLSDPLAAIVEAGRVLKAGGRCLIVDFAPHDLEFLRETFAHERLGFANEQMRQWMEEAHFHVTGHQELKPSGPGAGQKLTVSVWSAEKEHPPQKQPRPKLSKRLEGALR